MEVSLGHIAHLSRTQQLEDAEENIKTLVNASNFAWLQLGRELKKIRDGKLYESAGFATWTSYVGDRLTDLGVSRRSVDTLLGVADIQRSLNIPDEVMDGLGKNKARIIKEAAKIDRRTKEVVNSDEVRALIEDAALLPTVTVVEKARAIRGKDPQERFALRYVSDGAILYYFKGDERLGEVHLLGSPYHIEALCKLHRIGTF